MDTVPSTIPSITESDCGTTPADISFVLAYLKTGDCSGVSAPLSDDKGSTSIGLASRNLSVLQPKRGSMKCRVTVFVPGTMLTNVSSNVTTAACFRIGGGDWKTSTASAIFC